MASSAAAAVPTSTTAAALPLDAAPFLVAEVGGSQQTQYDLHALANAYSTGEITARSLIYRPDLTDRRWLPIASSHPAITAALAIPHTDAPPTAGTATSAAVAGPTGAPLSSASAAWYYVDSQRQRAGPVPAESLHALHRTGSVTDTTLVWHGGLTEWLPWKQASSNLALDTHSKQHDDEKEGNDSEADEEHANELTATVGAADSNTATGQVNHKRKKRKKPTKANTAVYATGLPTDLTVDEAAAFFKKAGVIRADVKTQEQRIKLYRDDETGRGKGDATVNYMFSDSVPLALTLLDGAEIRPGYTVTVTEAKFDSAGGRRGGTGRTDKRNKVETILAKRQKEVALSWQGDDSSFHSPLPAAAPTATSNTANGLRIVVLSHLFTPAEALAAADEQDSTDEFFEELTSDIGSELEAKCGSVDKMTVYEHSDDGVVVVKFKTVEAAEQCVRVMRGRRFGGREIGVEWWDGRDYSVRETAEAEKERLERFAAALEGDET